MLFRSVIKEYGKITQRNKKKDDAHLNKHAMHLIRLYLMCIDILETGDIVTYRKNDLPLLMAIRNGEYQKEDGTFRQEFYDMLDVYEQRMQYAKKNTDLPPKPDYKKIEEFVIMANLEAIKITGG